MIELKNHINAIIVLTVKRYFKLLQGPNSLIYRGDSNSRSSYI